MKSTTSLNKPQNRVEDKELTKGSLAEELEKVSRQKLVDIAKDTTTFYGEGGEGIRDKYSLLKEEKIDKSNWEKELGKICGEIVTYDKENIATITLTQSQIKEYEPFFDNNNIIAQTYRLKNGNILELEKQFEGNQVSIKIFKF